MVRFFIALLALLQLAATEPRPDLRLDTVAAEAVIEMLDGHAAGRPPSPAQWNRLIGSSGYRRLKERESVMGRAFTDEAFAAFIADPQLVARRDALRATLERWRSADLSQAAAKAAAYLPEGARFRATVYPMIKPRPNSFVFDLEGDPAIFLHLDPQVEAARFENIVAHELHHIGFAAACAGRPSRSLGAAAGAIRQWSSALGEGVAMMAAAGGPDIHPHNVSADEDRARWDRDVVNYPADFARLSAFFTDVHGGRLKDDAVRERAMSFFGVQGPWYTVGWRMAQAVEQQFGRKALVDSLCNRHALFLVYNMAADRQGLPKWPRPIVEALAGR